MHWRRSALNSAGALQGRSGEFRGIFTPFYAINFRGGRKSGGAHAPPEPPGSAPLVICQENGRNWQFSEITSSRWQEGNNRLQISITCLDHQGHNFLKLTKKFILLFHISICWLCKKNIDFCLWTTSQLRMLDRCVLCNFANFLIPGLI